MNFKQLLIDGKTKLGVWGCGYIGFTTMINFAKEGVYSIGFDVDKNVVDKIKMGESHIPNLDFWIGYHIEALVKDMIRATPSWKDMMADDVKVHLIAVPTERGGDPWHEPLQEVMNKLTLRQVSASNPDLIMIESTLTPGMFDEVVVGTLKNANRKVGEDILVGIAPRRDWFDSPEKNLKALPRVIGGTTPETTMVMKEVLGIVCDNLIESDAHTVELVKSVENSIFHICATYACQLANAYPDVDIAEVLRLASTHWRIPLYYPSVGTGGYCIPVSSKYVRDGALLSDYLGLTNEAIRSDYQQPIYIADIMAEKVKGGSIGILGLSYKRDLKVHVLSPSLRIIERLKEKGISVKVYDPYYTSEEVQNITGVDTFEYPQGLQEFNGLIIVPPHRVYSQTPKNILFQNLKEGLTILDNEGIWNKWRTEFTLVGIDYHTVGDKGWSSIAQKPHSSGLSRTYTIPSEV